MSAKAEEATEAKLNFFTNVSHEFRTPLTLMLSPLEDMLNNERLVALAGKNIKLINQNAFRLLKLVNQLIDYRKIQFDKQNLKASENNIVDFVRDIMESFRLLAQKLNINLNLSSKEKKINVWFDVNMLDKVFFNLISNAIKFCKEDGQVKITISKNDDNYVHIDVEDNGIGMSPEDTALIFEQFYQAENAPVTGSGIGLSLSREIVLFHHGHIEVKSQRFRGSIFSISLPLGDQHLSPIEKSYNRNEWPNMLERSKKYHIDIEKTPEAGPLDIVDRTKDFSMLIIEDNQDLLEYLADKFREDFEVFTAADGNLAMKRAFELVPDIIVSDVVLTGLSGKEISARLKSDFRTSHIPIILLTAQGSIEHQISGMESMADLYITKPFNFDFLLASVHNLLKNRVMLKEHYTSDISTSEKLPLSKTLDKKFLNDLSAIVEQNLANEKFDVEDICQAIGISRVQLYRKAKALLGCSITDYVLNRRLKKAKYLLLREENTISEIAYLVGFSNPNYFSTVFKAKYNCTPSEFKKKNVQNG